jgi:hypothetical protein
MAQVSGGWGGGPSMDGNDDAREPRLMMPESSKDPERAPRTSERTLRLAACLSLTATLGYCIGWLASMRP